MQIQLNGKNHPLEKETTISDFLHAIGLGGKPVVVELNEVAILPQNFATTGIENGDKLEVVTLAAGG